MNEDVCRDNAPTVPTPKSSVSSLREALANLCDEVDRHIDAAPAHRKPVFHWIVEARAALNGAPASEPITDCNGLRAALAEGRQAAVELAALMREGAHDKEEIKWCRVVDRIDAALNGVTQPASSEADRLEELLVAAYKRGFHFCNEIEGDDTYLTKAARDYADYTMNAPSTEVEKISTDEVKG